MVPKEMCVYDFMITSMAKKKFFQKKMFQKHLFYICNMYYLYQIGLFWNFRAAHSGEMKRGGSLKIKLYF